MDQQKFLDTGLLKITEKATIFLHQMEFYLTMKVI